MRRRRFIAICGAATAWAALGRAQKAIPLIGFLGGASFEAARPTIEPWLEGMRELGLVQDKTIAIKYAFAEGDYRKLPSLTDELLKSNPTVICAATSLTAKAAAAVTAITPIVCPLISDVITKNDARPDGNITGVRESVQGMSGKLLDLTRDLIPTTRRIGVLVNGTLTSTDPRLSDLFVAAQTAKIDVVNATVLGADQFEDAFRRFADSKVDASIVRADSMFFANRDKIASLAAELRIPTIYGMREHVASGGLASYGVDFRENYRRAAYFIDRILKGVPISNLPIEFPTKFVLALNLKTASGLGLEIPSLLLQRADEVIE